MRLLLFYRLMVRPLFREPVRTALTILAVALGVAVVIAIELAGDAAAGSFRSSVETLAGDSEIEVTATGGVPDTIVGKLATLPYAMRVHPRIEDYAVLPDSGESVPLVGLDLIAEAADRENGDQKLPNLADESEKGADVSNSVWVGRRIAAHAGNAIRLQINDHTREYTVRDVLPSSAGENVVIMDIAEAQLELGRTGRVDRVLVRVPDKPSLEIWQQRLRQALPQGMQVRPQGSGTDENRRMLAAFRWNLRILSYVALVVGAFLIYNTISVSVVRRRPEIGVVRALGASRGTVLGAFLGEAIFFGVAGALLALPLGRLMAIAAVNLLSTTVNALYVSSRPGSIAITWWLVGLALLIGVGVAVLSALSPASEAAQVSPVEAMARGQREYTARVHKWRDLWIALALGCAGTLATKVPAIAGKPLFGYLSAILFIGASAMAMPAIVELILVIATRALRSLFGIEALLASRSLVGSLRRTAVLVGALSTAIAMMTSVGIMVGSFRQTVVVWMDSQLPADLYLRPAGNPGIDKHPTISIDLANRIEKLPGVEAVDRFRSYDISYQGMPATLASAETRTSRYYRASGFVSGQPALDVVRELQQDHTAIVSEPFANKHHVKAGDTLTLPIGERDVSFRVIDIFYDYASESGFVILDRSTMLRYLPDPAPTNLAVYLNAGTDLDTVRHEIEQVSANHDVLIFSNRDIRNEAVRIFDQTFAITYALEAVAIMVAVMGIAGALLALVIDRRRELGLLRFLGASTGQIRKMILVEAGVLGMLSNLAGLALGFVLSLVLIYVVNKQSFGWTIQFHWPVAVLAGALSFVYLATVLAGSYPARIATRLNPIEVVHEE
jgi:putative ABC transport system permease protein